MIQSNRFHLAWKMLPILVFIFFSRVSTCSHIVGGEIIYEYLSHSSDSSFINYQIVLNLYRDPEGINYDPQVDFGIYRQNSLGEWEVYDLVRDVPIGPVYEIDPHTNPCRLLFINNTKLEATTYSFSIRLEVSSQNYMISYQKCCRNYTINNIDYDRVGAVYDIIITPEAQRLQNSSPSFTEIPPHFICQGYALDIQNNGYDSDGDSLVYSFCNPIFPAIHADSPPGCCGCTTPDPNICPPDYLNLEFIAPYSSVFPLGGSPQIEIQSDNGLFHGIPTTLGSYVVAICLEEYRDGILLSSVRRDFEFNVIPCSEKLIASVESDSFLISPDSDDPIAYFESCHDTTFQIINLSADETFIEDYRWDIYDSNLDLVYSENGKDLRHNEITIDNSGTYYGQMILNDGKACMDTAYLQFYIPEKIVLDFDYSFDPCLVGPVQFQNLSTPIDSLNFQWDFGDDEKSNLKNPNHSYDQRGNYDVVLSVENEIFCTDTLEKSIHWNPAYLVEPDTIFSDTILCYHDSIFINSNWIFTPGIYFDYIPSNVTGCDSVILAYHIDFTPPIFPDLQLVNLCEGNSYFFNYRWISEEGTYWDTLVSYQECDSIIGVELRINETDYYEYQELICSGDTLSFGLSRLTESGVYRDTMKNRDLCDSVIVLNLQIIEEKQSNIDVTICNNYNYNFNGIMIQETGVYQDTVLSDDGCDSMIVLSLLVLPTSDTIINDTICQGEEYLFGNEKLFVSGSYSRILTNQYGCDSLVTLNLYTAVNLTRIDLDDEVEEEYGTTIILEPEIIGPELVYYSWSETNMILSNSLQLEYTVSDENWLFFESTNIYYCIARDSIFIKTRIEKEIYIPNIFTPDGDQFNDTFYLGASPTLAASKLYVFDRWGNKMYEGEKVFDHSIINGWDGTYQDRPAEPGTYVYMFELVFINGDFETKGGSFHLIR